MKLFAGWWRECFGVEGYDVGLGRGCKVCYRQVPVLNQRIEWHSQSVNEHGLSVFKSEFYDLEREGVSDPLKETDLFCLHYVYLPRLKKNLTKFVSAHNNHKILTEVKLIANWWAWELVPKRLVGRPTVKNKLWKGSQAALEAGTTPASSR